MNGTRVQFEAALEASVCSGPVRLLLPLDLRQLHVRLAKTGVQFYSSDGRIPALFKALSGRPEVRPTEPSIQFGEFDICARELRVLRNSLLQQLQTFCEAIRPQRICRYR